MMMIISENEYFLVVEIKDRKSNGQEIDFHDPQ